MTHTEKAKGKLSILLLSEGAFKLSLSLMEETCLLYTFTNLFHNFSEYIYFCPFIHKDLVLFSNMSPSWPVALREEAETNLLKCQVQLRNRSLSFGQN